MSKKVLLVGSTLGQSSVGLLHLAGFLRRNGIEAYCHVSNDSQDRKSLKRNLNALLSSLEPDILGVSFKWFQHLARGIEICKIAKEASPRTVTVVGGNTASFYWPRIIDIPYVDYVIRGDGEVPLLLLCEGRKEVPNCVYRKDGRIIVTPFSYVENERNSGGVFLSHLEEIAFPRGQLSQVEQLFIYTGKGCAANCFYCGGGGAATLQNFNRTSPFVRNPREARKDLIEARKHVSSFLFDFESVQTDSIEYHQQLWEGIDLSTTNCTFYCWTLPRKEILALISKTFRNALIGIDLTSLSERLRLRLSSLGIVKPQPTDSVLVECLDEIQGFHNLSFEINMILGMPETTVTDMEREEEMVASLLDRYSAFSALRWGRLHAQPGAPILSSAEQYGMSSLANGFEEFLKISKFNLDRDPYPSLDDFAFPAIYHKDRSLMAKTTQHFFRMNRLLERHNGKAK